MKLFLKILSLVALAGIIVPPLLFLAGMVDKPHMKLCMLLGTIVWFASVPWWMGRDAGQANH